MATRHQHEKLLLHIVKAARQVGGRFQRFLRAGCSSRK
jgi:hypothetical protein